ncbi:unnamed protein product, partial [Staurois parvus]
MGMDSGRGTSAREHGPPGPPHAAGGPPGRGAQTPRAGARALAPRRGTGLPPGEKGHMGGGRGPRRGPGGP